ncbi:MAG: hypothetical protein JNM36_06030 [Chitinophagales bacterium]|nr:hypothetical protein [Chitinophagales bacterium]
MRYFVEYISISDFFGRSLRSGCSGLRCRCGASQATHWLTPPATSLTRFAIRISGDMILNNGILFRQNNPKGNTTFVTNN